MFLVNFNKINVDEIAKILLENSERFHVKEMKNISCHTKHISCPQSGKLAIFE